jgi:VIT1/CCC1 family predicted Fe2+/Mn2+ transporter
MKRIGKSLIKKEHQPGKIRSHLNDQHRHSYLGDAVLGGIDGGITTFAVVAVAIGAGFPELVIIVLGFANLLADGFSMAVSNYLGTKSRRDQVKEARRIENPSPTWAAFATFSSFMVVGLIPLVPFIIPGLSVEERFITSSIAIGMAFLGIGLTKGVVLNGRPLKSGIETLITGGGAAVLAFMLGKWLERALGV